MAAAAKTTVVQVTEIVRPGGIDPEVVVTPGIFVDRIVQIAGMGPLAETGTAG
jgi:3-oxoadipate CoA-transferase alpha subunit